MGGGAELDGELARGLAESAPDALIVVDGEGRIVFSNVHVEAMFGYARDELAGQRVEVLIPERFRKVHVAHRAAFANVEHARPMGAGLGELVGRRRDGAEFPVEVSLSPVPTSRGTFYAAAVRDATERLRIERTLRDAEERFRVALDEAPIGIALVGLDRRFFRVNRALASIVGYTPEELTGLSFQDITHPEDVDVDVEAARKLERGRSRATSARSATSGKTARLFTSPSACPSRATATARHFTTSRKSRTSASAFAPRPRCGAARRASTARNVSRTSGAGTRTFARKSSRARPRCTRIYGLAPAPPGYDEPGTLSQYIHPDDRDRVFREVDRVTREGGCFSVEHRIVRPDRTERVVLQQGESTNEGGRPVQLVGTCLDITNRKRAEREREESLRWMRAVLEQSPVGLILGTLTMRTVHEDESHRGLFEDRAHPPQRFFALAFGALAIGDVQAGADKLHRSTALVGALALLEHDALGPVGRTIRCSTLKQPPSRVTRSTSRKTQSRLPRWMYCDSVPGSSYPGGAGASP